MPAPEPETLQIGVSRPALPLDDLPTPEEVFNKPRIGARELIMVVLGPSMIALGASLGSREWLLGLGWPSGNTASWASAGSS